MKKLLTLVALVATSAALADCGSCNTCEPKCEQPAAPVCERKVVRTEKARARKHVEKPCPVVTYECPAGFTEKN